MLKYSSFQVCVYDRAGLGFSHRGYRVGKREGGEEEDLLMYMCVEYN